jgi:3-deoxy-manno-octulosonate cytidylyltransferase (CMP-KDO synthetase)
MKILGIIPARYASTRFPGKPLVEIAGTSMIQRVYNRVQKSQSLSHIIIATDDQRIFDHAKSFGANVVLTSNQHTSGTDRCNEVLNTIEEEYDFVINIQGDEPFIHPEQIDQLSSLLSKNVELATLAKKISDPKRLLDSNSVKVIFDKNQYAIYFSRHPIPFNRDQSNPEKWLEYHTYYKHIGMYAYRSDVLNKIAQLEPSSLEKSESLEQLRWMENSLKIKVGITDLESPNIDSPEDIENLNLKKLLSN